MRKIIVMTKSFCVLGSKFQRDAILLMPALKLLQMSEQASIVIVDSKDKASDERNAKHLGGITVFELKKYFKEVGGIDVGMGGGGTRRYCDAHIIGVIKDSNGNCRCRAWENKEQRLIAFEDNIYNMKYRSIGALSLEVQGIKI